MGAPAQPWPPAPLLKPAPCPLPPAPTRRGLPSAALALLSAAWSAAVASKALVAKSPGLDEQRSLLAVPCLLVYGAFALLTAY
jgi:hypothetical protein